MLTGRASLLLTPDAAAMNGQPCTFLSEVPSLSPYQHWYQVVDLLFLQPLQHPHYSTGWLSASKSPSRRKCQTSCLYPPHKQNNYLMPLIYQVSISLCIHIVKCKTGRQLTVCGSYVRVHVCFASACASKVHCNRATPVTWANKCVSTNVTLFNPYPTAFPYGNGMVLHFYQQQESSMTKTVHKVINKGLKTYV